MRFSGKSNLPLQPLPALRQMLLSVLRPDIVYSSVLMVIAKCEDARSVHYQKMRMRYVYLSTSSMVVS